MERDFYVLAYDMSNDRRRAKIAKLMEAVGERVQGSVFEAYLTPAELEKLLKRVGKVLDQKQDSLRIYYLCEACRRKPRMIGKSTLTPPPKTMIV
jgi:CRISPR-associated protein Cas2